MHTRPKEITITDYLEGMYWDRTLITGFTECWQWVGNISKYGYGRLAGGNHTWLMAHRFSWLLAGKTLDPTLVLDHICRNRGCVNPVHLQQVTERINTLAPGSLSPSAVHARKTHCIRGHEFAAENTYRDKDNNRHCKTCWTLK